jgi:hypothetical protein
MLENVAKHLLQDNNHNKEKYETAIAKYSSLKLKLAKSLSIYHWSEEHQAFFDTGVSYPMKTHLMKNPTTASSSSLDYVASIGQDVMISCSNPENGENKIIAVPYNYETSDKVKRDNAKKRNGCPMQYPKFNWPLGGNGGGYLLQNAVIPPKKTTAQSSSSNSLTLFHSNGASYQYATHVGYVTLFPMLLTVLDPQVNNSDEAKLLALINLLKDENVLWSPYGIRSLSKQDLFYAQVIIDIYIY